MTVTLLYEHEYFNFFFFLKNLAKMGSSNLFFFRGGGGSDALDPDLEET